ncbi:MAG: long-chain fatty acid--CoA ligase [Candidatus Obscuribacter phosphatis]|uniref:Long-chain fatty acid--CoA ligase n=1 Tax=Candidatus Obscuribacter phosphatis TaxID=1906157 RepID=A0A8J7PIS6_9BACT|nr:long-chain fatty acid--CoA ligase [Candidatus Obscuribacter phosphatis]
MVLEQLHSDRITERNLAAVFYTRAKGLAEHPAIKYKDKKEPYRDMSWREFSRLVRETALGLMTLGLKPDEKAAIFSSTTHWWVAADLATISNGAVSVPIYPTSSASDIKYIVDNSQARIIFVQNEALLKKLLAVKDELNIHKIVVFHLPEGIKSGEDLAEKHNQPRGLITDVESLRKLGGSLDTAHLKILEDRMKGTSFDSIATIIYTSGTTGVPKGVPLTHGNIISVLEDIRPILPIDENDVYLSYLPLSHVFERICGEFYWLARGGTCAFAEGIETMARNMAESDPSMILVVPRVLDRIYAKVKAGIEGASGKKKALIEWALTVGEEMVDRQAEKRAVGPILLLKHLIADKLALSKLREKIGPNLRLVVSGGAPATKETLRFFNSIGISTLEGYGLTETAAPSNVNLVSCVRMGTVGPCLPSLSQKIAEDGEILVKGPSIFKGYYKNEEATREAFDGEWFRTGDIGEFDEMGYLRITDRKKDLIVNSAGKNIAPQKIEAILKTVPTVAQAVVFGDKQKHLVALLTLEEQAAMDLGRELNLDFNSYFDLSKHPDFVSHLRKEIAARSRTLADYEQVKRFTILASDLSVEAGELTATLKIKRNVVAKNYQDIIESMYKHEESSDHKVAMR